MNKKVLLGMSGGVDSSVAALILKEQGYDVEGVTLKLHCKKTCSGKQDLEMSNDIIDAQNVAKKLNIPHHVVDLTKKFSNIVISNFIDEYTHGRTPNPCVVCNKNIKFGAMLDTALDMGMSHIATGHYADVKYDEDRKRWLLYKSDSPKDQSYVLYHLTQHQLSHAIFPLINMKKDETRLLAEKNQLGVAHKSDSQEICFIDNDDDYVSYIERYTNSSFPKGKFVDLNGNVIGEHKGIIYYTIGQRKGLGMTFGQPMFVCKIDAVNNTVVLGPNGSQLAKALIATDINYISVENIDKPTQVFAKTRYQAQPAKALLTPKNDGTVLVEFEQLQRSVTPGQSVVFYDGNIVVGGGIIKESIM